MKNAACVALVLGLAAAPPARAAEGGRILAAGSATVLLERGTDAGPVLEVRSVESGALLRYSETAMTAACTLPRRDGAAKGLFLGPDVTDPSGSPAIVVAHDPCRTLEAPAPRPLVEARVNGEWLACAEDGSECWITKGSGGKWDRTSPLPLGGARLGALFSTGGKSPTLFALAEVAERPEEGPRVLTSRDRGKSWQEVAGAKDAAADTTAAITPRGLWLLQAPREAGRPATLRLVDERGEAGRTVPLE